MRVYEEMKAQRGIKVKLKEPTNNTITYSKINQMDYQDLNKAIGGGGKIFKPSDIVDQEEEYKDDDFEEALVNYEETQYQMREIDDARTEVQLRQDSLQPTKH